MFPNGEHSDLPVAARPVPPDSFPRWFTVTVSGLELVGVDHPEAPTRLGTEGDDEVAWFRHRGHGQTVEWRCKRFSLYRPLGHWRELVKWTNGP